MNKQVKIFSIIIGLLLLGTSIIGLIFRNDIKDLAELFNDPFNDKKFDRQVWIANNYVDSFNNPRGQMIFDLKNSHLKTGMSKARVYELLGKPHFDSTRWEIEWDRVPVGTTTSFTKEYYEKYGRLDTVMLYPIGWYTGMDPDFFTIRFTHSGNVKDFWIEHH